MQDILQYIIDEAYILIPALYVIGVFLKHTPYVKDWMIPWVLLGVGILLAVPLVGELLKGIIQGVLTAGMTVLAHQLIKQTTKRK